MYLIVMLTKQGNLVGAMRYHGNHFQDLPGQKVLNISPYV